MPLELRALNHTSRVPIPFLYPEDKVQIGESGEQHSVRMFPAIVREERVEVPQIDELTESGATCFYHDKNPAVAICEESGRMICALCKTEWEGRIVSVQALQERVSGKNDKKKSKGPFRWDRLAFAFIVETACLIFCYQAKCQDHSWFLVPRSLFLVP